MQEAVQILHDCVCPLFLPTPSFSGAGMEPGTWIMLETCSTFGSMPTSPLPKQGPGQNKAGGEASECALCLSVSLCKVFRRLRVHGPGKHYSVIGRGALLDARTYE